MKPISKGLVACALVVTFSLFSTHALAIEIDFAPGVVIGGGANGNLIIDMEPFDFDQDGDVDLVGITGNLRDELRNNIDLFLNDGDNTTFTNVVLASSRTPRQVAIADINNDGWMDILYTDLRNGRVFWHENQFGSGGGFSGQRSAVTSAWWADGLGIGDLDDDGDLDIAFTIRNNGDVRWIANQLNEPTNNDFSSMRTIGRGIGNARQAAIADINADGKLDVVVGGGESNGSLVWYDNTDGLGSAWVVNTIDAGNFTCINPQDFDEDGNIDLVVQENNSSSNPGQRMAVWLNTTGNGLGFTEQVISTNIGRDAYDNCEMADLDFDGDFDFVGSSDGEWFDNIDGTVFTLRNFDSSSGDTDHQSMRLMDIDGDGDQDIFTAQFDRERFTYYENEFCNAGDPDFDLDGIPDACDGQIVIDDVTVNEGDSGITTVTFTVTLQIDLRGNVTYQTRAGSATPGDDYASTNGTLAFVTGIAGESFTVSVDVNGDADPEVPETFFLDLQSSDFVINDDVGTATILNDDGTSISIDDASISEGDSSQTDLVFTVSLAVETAPFTVPFSTSDGSATAGSDYTVQMGDLSFDGTSGETQTITVPITGDTFVENDENFFVTLGAPSDASVAVLDETGEGTILNDDTASVSIFDAGFDEADVGDGTLDFIVELSGSTNFPFQVNFETRDGTATAGSDYNDNDGSLSFSGNDGEQRRIRVTVLDDDVLEGPETVLAMLTGTSNPAITIATADATGTISDDDRSELAIQNGSVVEGDSGERSLMLDVHLNGGVQGGFSVPFSTADNTALAGSDYTAVSDTLTFVGTGGEVQSISIPVTGDGVVETDETFLVNLGAPSNSAITVSTGQATGTIENDDEASIAIADIGGLEGDTDNTISLTVTLSGTVQDGFTVDFASSDDNAEAGSDYIEANGTLNFIGSDGEMQTIDLTINGDEIVESDESFTISLAEPSNSFVLRSGAEANVLIANDDNAEISISDVSVDEGNSGTTAAEFIVSVNAAVQDGFMVDYATADDTATAGSDYEGNTGQLVFDGTLNETQTITVNVIGDEEFEADETFFVNLLSTNNIGQLSFSDSQGLGTIRNDDSGIRDCISVASGNWSDTATWSCDGEPSVPDDDDNVVIDTLDTVTLDVDVQIGTVNANPDSGLVINPNPVNRVIDCTIGPCSLENAAVTLNGGLRFDGGSQEVTVGDVDGAFDLTLVSSDSITVFGDIGGATSLSEILFEGGPEGDPSLLAAGSISTTEDLLLRQPLVLLGDVTLDAPNIGLPAASIFAGRSGRGLSSNLTVNTPGILGIGGRIGSQALPLSSLTVTGNGLVSIDMGFSVDQIYTSGGQIYEAGLLFDNPTQLNAAFIVFENPFFINQDLSLNVSADGSEINAALAGDDTLTKSGAGDLLITSVNTYTGDTVINGGSLRIADSGVIHAGSVVTLNSGVLGGNGRIDGPVIANGGTIDPGLSPGILSTGGLLLDAAAVFSVEINGLSTPGTDYDQLNVTGTVTLNNATLELVSDLIATGSQQVITLIENDGVDPVVGTFGNLPEGAFVINNGPWQISYQGGDGNDVVLIDNEGVFSDGFETASLDTPL